MARHPVGIDAEWLGQKVDLGIASTVLAPYELHELSARPPAQRPRRFLEYWTLKEAFVKATGKGMSQPLDRFWFRLERVGKPTIGFAAGDSSHDDQWQFLQLNELSRGHLLAVAVKPSAPMTLGIETWHAPGIFYRPIIGLPPS
ncbi:MAG: 4'-phosphopantetheinyl transferase superfamily protein [Nitrospirota bacterium]|nr:4'-phosphopantetheinyl transferase superfamily protein [Nitrospirota bacterium]